MRVRASTSRPWAISLGTLLAIPFLERPPIPQAARMGDWEESAATPRVIPFMAITETQTNWAPAAGRTAEGPQEAAWSASQQVAPRWTEASWLTAAMATTAAAAGVFIWRPRP